MQHDIYSVIELAEAAGIKYDLHDVDNSETIVEFMENERLDFFGEVIRETEEDRLNGVAEHFAHIIEENVANKVVAARRTKVFGDFGDIDVEFSDIDHDYSDHIELNGSLSF